MGQKTNPIGNRLGIIRGWDSNWYGGNDGDKLAEDHKISISMLVYQKLVYQSNHRENFELVTVTITTARPGIIIGKVDKR
jgi:small subunit ribosomal protein S3